MVKERNRYGGRPQILHGRISRPIVFEDAMIRDFEELCSERRISVSEGIRELVNQELQKNAIGPGESGPMLNPLNLPNQNTTNGSNKSMRWLGTLDRWLTRTDAIKEIKKVDNPEVIEIIGTNMIIASRFKRTGVYRPDLKIY